MKKSILGMAIAMLIASCSAQPFVIRGNGRVANGAFDISLNYNSLSVDRGIKVILVHSEIGQGFIAADEEVLGYVSIEQDSGHIKVSYSIPNLSIRTDVETTVTLPVGNALNHLMASSAAKIVSEQEIVCRELELDGSSAANFDLIVDASNLDIELSSAANSKVEFTGGVCSLEASSAAICEMGGSADLCRIEISSAANFKGFGLVCREVDTEASSGAIVETYVTETLTAEVTSGASVRYKGSPSRVYRDTSSGGSITSVE